MFALWPEAVCGYRHLLVKDGCAFLYDGLGDMRPSLPEKEADMTEAQANMIRSTIDKLQRRAVWLERRLAHHLAEKEKLQRQVRGLRQSRDLWRQRCADAEWAAGMRE